MLTATVANTFLSYKIAKIGMTSTTTWTLFTMAFAIRLAAQMLALFYISEIISFAKTFPNWMVMITTVSEALIMLCFLLGILRTFISLRKLGVK